MNSEYFLLSFKSEYSSPFKSKFRSPSPTPVELSRNLSNSLYLSQNLLKFLYLKILLLTAGIVVLSCICLWQLSYKVWYIKFNVNLSTYKRKTIQKELSLVPLLYFLISIILLIDSDMYQTLCFFVIISPDTLSRFRLNKKMMKFASRFLHGCIIMYIFSTSVSSATCILSLVVFQSSIVAITKNVPHWLSFVLILLSNDIEFNPGPLFQNSFFTFMSWNLNSLAKNDFQRISLIEAHNSVYNYDLISLCETSLNDNVELPESLLEDYTFEPANHPSNTRRGGVGLLYKTSLPVIIRKDLSFPESIVAELKFGKKKVFFTVLYRSPSNDHNSAEFQNFLSDFKNLYLKIKAENPFASYFAGDFNGHSQLWWPDGVTTPEGDEIEKMLTSLNLSQLISEPTNFTPGKKPSCIDLIITDQPNLILDSGTRASLDPLCHHQIVHCKVNFTIPPPPPVIRTLWHFDRANKVAIQQSMSNFPWENHLSLNNNPNWQIKSFTEILLNIMSNFVPHEKKRIVPRDLPWISKSLKSMIRRKNRLFKNYKRHGYKEEDNARLVIFRMECQKAVDKAKHDYLLKLGNKVYDPATSQKYYWKILNQVMNKSRAPKIPPLLFNNAFILNCAEKAKLFNDFFGKQCKPVANGSVLPYFKFVTNKRISTISIENHDIISLVRKLNPSKASGSDGISGQMLLLCDNSVTLPLQIIFNTILKTSIYPDNWKLANLTPIFKKGDKQLIKNYRPISLLPICGKMFEKIIFQNFYGFFTENNLITKNQSGFRPSDSTTNQLLFLVDEIHKGFDDTKSLETRAVFLDISKAFDKVWHEGLIFKLRQNGVSGGLLKLMENYLHNRKQRVVLNGSESDYVIIESGVPQGSVLGPLLFLIYINDLESNIKSNVKFFADDTMLFSIVTDPQCTANELNHDLDVICKWAYQWKMQFNPDPSKQATEVLFSCKKSFTNHPGLFFNGSLVPRVHEQKHLGLILQPNLSFEKHLNVKMIKAMKNIGILKHLSHFLPLRALDQMYKAHVRSHLEYCDIIYHIPSIIKPPPLGVSLHTLMEKVERIQYQAALAITGTWQGSSRSKLYDELGWESLSDRRMLRRVLQIHKIISKLTPSYLYDKLPQTRRPFLENVFREIKFKTNRYGNSFYPNAISLWNIIITHFDHFPTRNTLKEHITSLIRPSIKGIINIHDPEGLRYLFQLRVGLSPLRCHKKRHNFVDTPSDICLCNKGIESTSHFLLSCLLYDIPRVALVNSVNEVLRRNNLDNPNDRVKLYLYGHFSLDILENRIILLSTIRYIKSTNRFSI